MSIPLERPAPAGDVFDVKTHVGSLLVIEPLEDVPPMVTKASTEPVPAIRCNVYVVAPPGQVSETFRSALLFQRLLHQRLRQSIGKRVVGILTGQPGVTQNGRNVPYDLADPPDAAFEAASRAMAAVAMTAPADPWAAQEAPPGWGAAAQPATPAQPPWGQQPMPTPPASPDPWTGAWVPAPSAEAGGAPPWGLEQQ